MLYDILLNKQPVRYKLHFNNLGRQLKCISRGDFPSLLGDSNWKTWFQLVQSGLHGPLFLFLTWQNKCNKASISLKGKNQAFSLPYLYRPYLKVTK